MIRNHLDPHRYGLEGSDHLDYRGAVLLGDDNLIYSLRFNNLLYRI